MTDVERRWRSGRLYMRDDLLESSAGYPAALRAVRDELAFGEGADISAMRGASACRALHRPKQCYASANRSCVLCALSRGSGCSVSSAARCWPGPLRLVAAYTLAVSAFDHSRAWPASRPHGLALPPCSRLRRWLLPSPACSPSMSATCTSHASALESDPEDEVWWNPVVLPGPRLTVTLVSLPPKRALRPMPHMGRALYPTGDFFFLARARVTPPHL